MVCASPAARMNLRLDGKRRTYNSKVARSLVLPASGNEPAAMVSW